MILMNKFIRIYSYFPYIILMLMFRLLLYGEELIAAKTAPSDSDTENTSVDSDPNADERRAGGNVAEIFIAVIYPKSKETVFSRVIKQTVTSLSEDFTTATNLRVVPHYTAIADSDGYNIQEVQEVCSAWNHKPIIAVVVFSSFKSGFGHVLTSLHNNIPVLWATGELQPGYFERVPLSRFDVRLDPGSYEVLRSLRSLLLATHWHAFTVMHTTTLLASKIYQEIISQAPLLPTIMQFRPDSTSYYIFRLLSDVSKSTKGVVVLICEGADAKRVIEESKKLNMVNGDFVWLWIDTSAVLIKDKNIRLDRPAKEMNFIVETRKVRHAPNFYVNQSSKANVTSSKKNLRIRDNNPPNVGAPTSQRTPVFCNSTVRVRMYENKTDIKTLMYNNVINMNNEILPNVHKDASFSALMKHHFALYRKKAWRMNKQDDKTRPAADQPAKKIAASSNQTPFVINLANDNKNAENATALFLSVINDESIDRADQPIDDRKSKRFNLSDPTSVDVTERKTNDKSYPTGSRRDTENFTIVDGHRRFTISATATQNRLIKRKARAQESYAFDVPVFSDTNVTVVTKNKTVPEMPVGILALQLMPSRVDKNYVKSTLKLLINALKDVIVRYGDTKLSKLLDLPRISCFDFIPVAHRPGSIMEELTQNLKRSVRRALAGRLKFNETHLEESSNSSLSARFKILNLVPEENKTTKYENKTALESRKWRTIGHMIGEDSVHLETIVWPGGDIIPVSTGRGSRSIFRIVTAFAPPFVMIGELDEDGQCLRGIECHQFLTSDKDNLTLLFNEMERTEEEDEVNVLDRLQQEKRHMWDNIDIREHHPGHKFKTNCCYGLSMDLLENVAEELEFDFQLYIVSDGLFGTKTISDSGEQKWNGIVGDLVSGAAHLSFSALSVSSSRAQAIDFSVPYFFSGVSFLAAPKESTDIPLLAFLLPFSSNLWIAIFTSLHVTAAAVAIYEWLSPFGLNPWGRQRSKNFGVASALWVMWGLLCGHLVQFKAPKSWPNKFLINVWGGFSVIFIASYTANIAALIAGLFFHNTVGDHHDRSLLSQRVGAPKASAAEYYVKSTNQILWDHMQRYSVISVAEGVQLLKNGSLDILIADTPILDYYRATDHGCKLQRVGDTINEDTYAIGMTKGFPLKDSISAVIAKYASNGYMDILQEKWYGGLPCFKLATDMAQPRPLGVAAVAGVFLMLGCGVLVGCLILFSEHLFYKYTLPSLRKKPKSSIWKSRNVMFFSQKLYRFINCVELVSPHHAARELVHTLRQGQITSLFQKSVRRKEHEQRQQQQKSKAQFFEMIQEIRRVQQEERKDSGRLSIGKISPRKKYYSNKNPQILLSPTGLLKHRSRLSPGRLDFARRLSKDVFRSKSSGNLDVRRISSDFNVAAGRFFDFYSAQAIGRRLSHGTNDNSPPDMNARRASQFMLKDDSLSMNRSPSGSDLPENIVENKVISSSPSDTNLAKSPKSPTSIPSSSVSSNVFSPGRISNSFFSRDIGPLAARKFSNVDSSSFRGLKNKIQNKINTPKLTINNQEFLGCEGSNCGDDGKPEEYSNESKTASSRNNSVKSSEHIIEIVIPSDTGENTQNEPFEEKSYRHCGTDSEPEFRTCEDASPVSDDYDSKPKIILHLPKKKKNAKTQCSGSVDVAVPNKSACDSTTATSPLQRLSKDELVLLSQLSEKDLKENLLKALEEKDPT